MRIINIIDIIRIIDIMCITLSRGLSQIPRINDTIDIIRAIGISRISDIIDIILAIGIICITLSA